MTNFELKAIFRGFVLVFGLLVLNSAPAPAQDAGTETQEPKCTFSMSNISFGTVDLTKTEAAQATGIFTYVCTGDPAEIIRICPSWGLQDGKRFMTDDNGNSLFFNLFTDPEGHEVWGTWFGKDQQGPTIDVTLDRSGRARGRATAYGQISSGQQNIPPGPFTTTLKGTQTSIGYDYISNSNSCDQIKRKKFDRTPFKITATLANSGATSPK